ncbi:hypothetical protein [Rhizosaccharibacter radicis]|uniref:Transmembrane protein n=1 Tax=Rhizosaccharibacter radicis TaxID=2782605 RepID=A0ABT1VY37_9PROT|nr:hypothetical protein [Acetobacteraceae bacterium KSS12]
MIERHRIVTLHGLACVIWLGLAVYFVSFALGREGREIGLLPSVLPLVAQLVTRTAQGPDPRDGGKRLGWGRFLLAFLGAMVVLAVAAMLISPYRMGPLYVPVLGGVCACSSAAAFLCQAGMARKALRTADRSGIA